VALSLTLGLLVVVPLGMVLSTAVGPAGAVAVAIVADLAYALPAWRVAVTSTPEGLVVTNKWRRVVVAWDEPWELGRARPWWMVALGPNAGWLWAVRRPGAVAVPMLATLGARGDDAGMAVVLVPPRKPQTLSD
jgi:hypothetical protein